LGDTGSAQELEEVLQYLTAEAQLGGGRSLLLSTVDVAVIKLLRRDARCFSVLQQVFPNLTQPNKALLLHSVGGEASTAAVDFLTIQLEREPDLTSLVLSQLGRVAAAGQTVIHPRALFIVEGYLTSVDPVILRETCLTLGRMGSAESVMDLVDLLGHEGQGVSESAHWALQKITRKSFPNDAKRWRQWWEKEDEWWTDESPDVLHLLKSANPGEVGTALRTLAAHRLHRDMIAVEISLLLEHPSDTIVAQACATLEVLGSRHAIRALQKLVQRAPNEIVPHVELALSSCMR
jgi:hypothetical protein